ncbi:unnamed protein product [Aphanomyces euteiches]
MLVSMTAVHASTNCTSALMAANDTWCLGCQDYCFPVRESIQIVVNGQDPHTNTQANDVINTNVSTSHALTDSATTFPKFLSISATNGHSFTFPFDTVRNLKQLSTIVLDNVFVVSARPENFIASSQLSNITIFNCISPLALDLSSLMSLKHLYDLLLVIPFVLTSIFPRRTVQNCTLKAFPEFYPSLTLQTLHLISVNLSEFPKALPSFTPSASIDLSGNRFNAISAVDCNVISQLDIKIDGLGAANCPESSFTGDSAASRPYLAPPQSTSEPTEAPASSRTNPWNTISTIIIVLVLTSMVVVFVVHRRRLLNPSLRTPGAESAAYLTNSTPMIEGNDILLSKKKEELLSETLLTPFPPAYGRSYALLPPKDVKVLRRPKASTAHFVAQYQAATVTLHRLDFRDHEQWRIDYFLHQTDLVATLQHPNIVRLVGATKLSGISICAVFDITSTDETLPAFLFAAAKRDSYRTLTWSQQVAMALGLAQGLAHLHTKEPLPRTLSSNDILVRDVTCRINTLEWMDVTTEDSQRVTEYGQFVMASTAPEVLRRRRLPQDATDAVIHTRAADIFALGIIMGEIATCGRPFASWIDAAGPVAADAKIEALYVDSDEEIAPFGTLEQDRAFHDLVAQCLSRDPAARPDANAVVAALEACQVT